MPWLLIINKKWPFLLHFPFLFKDHFKAITGLDVFFVQFQQNYQSDPIMSFTDGKYEFGPNI